MKTIKSNFRPIAVWSALALVIFSLSACGPDKNNGNNPKPSKTGDTSGKDKLPTGDVAFVSADAVQGQERGAGGSSASLGATGEATAKSNDAKAMDSAPTVSRTVEEGDIYKVLNTNQILNLNQYRGLQIIDFSEVSKPVIAGRLAIAGSPVELYVLDTKVIVLLNNWVGYYGSRRDVKVDKKEGGLVALVDISNVSEPKLLDQAYVPGSITTSRLTRAGAQAALYVAANDYSDGTSGTVVKSFDVSGATVEPKTQLDLGGYVQDIQATPQALLVARNDYTRSQNQSQVTIVDISDPAGTMVQGDEVTVAGMVKDKFNMDLYKNVLRIVSGSSWSGSNTNTVQTYNAKDFSKLTELDSCSFSDGMSLYATLFLANKAFFVTYLRKDPFHAFVIGDDGHCEEQNQFVISGWNDYFRAILEGQRLVGVGVNDETGQRTVAVSLYDITDLSNNNPLVARAEVALDNSWSQANWDDKAFSVIEDAVSPEVAGGETGLVLVPFQGYKQNYQEYIAGVQIYTFSANSLTRRGVMEHGSSVQRTFLANPTTTANLSDSEISLFDQTIPDSPKEFSRLELAPNYTKLISYGDYAVRLRYGSYNAGVKTGSSTSTAISFAEIISLSENPDSAVAKTRIEIPSSAYLVKEGSHLVVVDTVWAGNVAKTTGSYVDTYQTTIDVYDMIDPLSPEKMGTVTTDKLRPSYSYGGYDGMTKGMVAEAMPYGGDYFWSGSAPNVAVVDGAVVFPQTQGQNKLIGKETVCSQYPMYSGMSSGPCSSKGECPKPSDYYSGGITCTRLNGGQETCAGEISYCTYADADNGYSVCCVPVDATKVQLSTNCYTNDRIRYWTSYSLYVLDLTGDAPRLTDPIEFATENQGLSVLASGKKVYYSYNLPYEVKGDTRPLLRYYIVEVDLSTPAKPTPAEPVNVPGELLAVDGNTIYTQDVIWGTSRAQSVINKLTLKDGLAYREASYLFANQIVQSVKLDGAGHVLVAHNQTWDSSQACSTTAYNDQTYNTKLTVLSTEDLAKISEIAVDSWATFKTAESGRALFQVSGGLMIINVQDPEAPFAQAYFATPGWPQDVLVENGNILIAAGPYGIYQFDASASNLLPIESSL
jgi:hypothetical protein